MVSQEIKNVLHDFDNTHKITYEHLCTYFDEETETEKTNLIITITGKGSNRVRKTILLKGISAKPKESLKGLYGLTISFELHPNSTSGIFVIKAGGKSFKLEAEIVVEITPTS